MLIRAMKISSFASADKSWQVYWLYFVAKSNTVQKNYFQKKIMLLTDESAIDAKNVKGFGALKLICSSLSTMKKHLDSGDIH